MISNLVRVTEPLFYGADLNSSSWTRIFVIKSAIFRLFSHSGWRAHSKRAIVTHCDRSTSLIYLISLESLLIHLLLDGPRWHFNRKSSQSPEKSVDHDAHLSLEAEGSFLNYLCHRIWSRFIPLFSNLRFDLRIRASMILKHAPPTYSAQLNADHSSSPNSLWGLKSFVGSNPL